MSYPVWQVWSFKPSICSFCVTKKLAERVVENYRKIYPEIEIKIFEEFIIENEDDLERLG